MTDFRAEHHLATIDADGALCDVMVRFSYDGLEQSAGSGLVGRP